MSDQEKTEQATERQIERFREEGKVATSRELTAALAMAAGFAALAGVFPVFASGLGVVDTTLHALVPDGELTHTEVVYLVGLVAMVLGPPLALALAAPAAVSLGAGLVMTGFNVSTDTLAPNFEKLDVFANARSAFFSMSPWVSLAKGVLVAAAMSWAVWAGVRDHLDALPVLARLGLGPQLAHGATVVSGVLRRAVPAALAIGALDYLYQRWKLGEDMKMSKQEVKEEHKDTDGDPHVKSRRKARARQLAMGSSLRNVKKADVVVANPTHYAVALRYRKEENAAPVVVARGVDVVALKIRAEATRHDILVVENRPLARALYAKSKAGMPIPREFYKPVADVLAIVYRRRHGSRPPGS